MENISFDCEFFTFFYLNYEIEEAENYNLSILFEKKKLEDNNLTKPYKGLKRMYINSYLRKKV